MPPVGYGLIIGAQKSGTTTIFRALASHPSVAPCVVKGPQFFSSDKRFRRGRAWYDAQFSTGDVRVRVEGSDTYTHPEFAARSAERIRSTLGGVRLIFVVRHPIDRLRSSYRHDVRVGRVRVPLSEAVRLPGNRYVGCSRYHECLAPYIETFDRDELAIARTEDLSSGPTWDYLLRHLGLEPHPLPIERHNQTEGRVVYTPFRRRLRRTPLVGRWLVNAPGPIRRRLEVDGSTAAQLLAESTAEVPPDVLDDVWRDVERFEQWWGHGPLWPRQDFRQGATHGDQ